MTAQLRRIPPRCGQLTRFWPMVEEQKLHTQHPWAPLKDTDVPANLSIPLSYWQECRCGGSMQVCPCLCRGEQRRRDGRTAERTGLGIPDTSLPLCQPGMWERNEMLSCFNLVSRGHFLQQPLLSPHRESLGYSIRPRGNHCEHIPRSFQKCFMHGLTDTYTDTWTYIYSPLSIFT